MNATAAELDRRLQSLPPETAASVEQLVRDVLRVVEAVAPASDREAQIAAHREHLRKVEQMLTEDDWSDFERPPQGTSETRDAW